MLRALGVDGRGYVLADRSCKLSPAGWARQAVDAYHEFKADCALCGWVHYAALEGKTL